MISRPHRGGQAVFELVVQIGAMASCVNVKSPARPLDSRGHLIEVDTAKNHRRLMKLGRRVACLLRRIAWRPPLWRYVTPGGSCNSRCSEFGGRVRGDNVRFCCVARAWAFAARFFGREYLLLRVTALGSTVLPDSTSTDPAYPKRKSIDRPEGARTGHCPSHVPCKSLDGGVDFIALLSRALGGAPGRPLPRRLRGASCAACPSAHASSDHGQGRGLGSRAQQLESRTALLLR